MNCLLGDAGIAIGLMSLPFRQEREFYDKEIKKALFPNYKNAVLKNFAPDLTGKLREDFEKHFYEPVPYYLFGSFDLAVITLVDDFEMTSRTFRPFDPALSTEKNKNYRENFFYKVITGPTPRFNPKDSIVSIAEQTFLGDSRPPLFAMSLLKLNNALLLGTGTEFLRLVVRFIHATAKEQKAKNPNLKVILLESYASHEITVLTFTDNYSAVSRLITTVRESRVGDLLRSESGAPEPDYLRSILQNCLLSDLPITGTKRHDIFSAPLFTDTESYFGFDFDLLDPAKQSLLEKINPDDFLDLHCQWYVRPGHLQTTFAEIKQKSRGDVSGCVGRGDLYEHTEGLPTRSAIEQVVSSVNENSSPKHARRRQTTPAVSPFQQRTPSGEQEDYDEPDLSEMRFSVGEIKEIQNHLRAVWTPKILTGKILNAFTNFNDGILDPGLYGYFIELLPLMELIQQMVARWHEASGQTDLSMICKTLEKLTDNFERGYRNRFYNSYRMGDITDFNLDFKGGIQQLLSSFDSAYKAICSVLGRKESFAYVAGSPGVYSTRHEVRLNYYHVFQPEIFGSIANHEAANFYLTRFSPAEVPPFARAGSLIDPELLPEPDETDGSVLRRVTSMKEHASEHQAPLLPFINKRLLNCVFVDLLAFYFGYNRNVRLFEHWYWGYFAQNSFAYLRREQVNEVQFVGFMLRLLWIERLSSAARCEPITFGNDSFDELWRKWRPLLSSFLDWLWADEEIKKWNAGVTAHVESTFLETHRQSEVETIPQICERTERQAAELKEKLKRGEVCLYSRVDDKSAFKFTEQIFYAYLSLLTEQFGEGDILLTRNADGIAELKTSSARALFDPIGGIFTHDPVTRRERFQYRAGLTMSLWDMAQKEKKALVLTRLNRASQER